MNWRCREEASTTPQNRRTAAGVAIHRRYRTEDDAVRSMPSPSRSRHHSAYHLIVAVPPPPLPIGPRGKVSNLIYVDQPTGTGFSCTTDHDDIRHDENGVSNELYDFLQAFFKEHPEYVNNEFYITGESYAGHYIPAFAARVHQGNKAQQGVHINLKGFAIGNGLTNPAIQYTAYADYALDNGLIQDTDHRRITTQMVPTCEKAIQLCGTNSDDNSCLSAYTVCTNIFNKIMSIAGDNLNSDQKPANLKDEFKAVISCLEDMRKKKTEREKQFLEVVDQINSILSELYRSSREALRVDPNDLSLKALEALQVRLDALQKEKSDRLKKIMDHLNTLSSLCLVLGIDFKEKIREIHPTLDDNKGAKNIDDSTIQKLSATVESLKEVKIQRLCKLQDLAGTLLELWNLMDTPPQEQHRFHTITSKIAYELLTSANAA